SAGTAATLQTITNNIALGALQNVTIGAQGATFNVANLRTLTINGVISGGGAIGAGITQSGAGTLTITNVPNTFTGGTTITNGVVSIPFTTALGVAATGPITL